ncbi:uncharacterized protein LOC129759689 [Uranotaenia lowii]|uniref:uncharacterized protein LOC129759689 n=1 Tax=Uranotaenia lowii TaxID=190385 RepID=UPI00247AAE9A|nr:uncharacterized protein LOC129759689 [Uranotaenia lowii]
MLTPMLWALLTAQVLILGVASSAQESTSMVPIPATLGQGYHPTTTEAGFVSTVSKSDGSQEKIIVVNWKLTCQQLCGAGYGGPACGLTCRTRTDAASFGLSAAQEHSLCPTLCKNGLGKHYTIN